MSIGTEDQELAEAEITRRDFVVVGLLSTESQMLEVI